MKPFLYYRIIENFCNYGDEWDNISPSEKDYGMKQESILWNTVLLILEKVLIKDTAKIDPTRLIYRLLIWLQHIQQKFLLCTIEVYVKRSF